MRLYLAIKYYADQSNRVRIEEFCELLESLGHSVYCVVRDLEAWGKHQFVPAELMQRTFEVIRQSDAMLIDLSEKGVGLGIEAGYAYASGKPIFVIA